MRLFAILFGVGIAALVTGTAYAALAVPRWAVPLCMLGALVVLYLLPAAIGLLINPVNSQAIRKYLEGLGATNISVRPYPNHYGVRFTANGKSHYAKCLVLRHGTFKWKGQSPVEMLGGARVA
jgi:hypothetical protein